ncbi:MAG: hypothetical protein AB7Q29_04130 [Vicinamibacterales bacterium]
MRNVIDRRSLLTALAGALAAVVSPWSDAEGGQPRRRRVRVRRRRVRRRVRRRIRRRIVFRTVAGRRVWIAPVALAVGWELLLAPNRVVVVKETRFVERSGTRVEVAVVQDSTGKTEEIEIAREDTADNTKNLQGSVLPHSDTATPAVEAEEEVEEEEEEEEK